jgi:Sortase domain
LRDGEWRRIAGLRVVMSWPQAGCAPPPGRLVSLRARVAGLAGVLLILAGFAALVVAVVSQVHAPQPAQAAAGAIGPFDGKVHGPSLRRSLPVSVDIPAIGVHSRLLQLGDNADGTVQVPSLATQAGEAGWYNYSATPGQIGTSVIVGHVDTYRGPAVFFNLGALQPGDRVDVTLADGITAVFRVTGVREYLKSRFPAETVYHTPGYAALHLITCGGAFDYTTRNYLSSTVVFASLTSYRHVRTGGRDPAGPSGTLASAAHSVRVAGSRLAAGIGAFIDRLASVLGGLS